MKVKEKKQKLLKIMKEQKIMEKRKIIKMEKKRMI